VIPDSGKDWWKAGAFHAPSTVGGGSVRVQWKTCFGQVCDMLFFAHLLVNASSHVLFAHIGRTSARM